MPEKRRLSTVDWAFLQTETPSRLAHVAGLWVFRTPREFRGDFWRDFMQGLDDPAAATPPFNYRLAGGLDLPSWVEDPEVDPYRHVHLHTLPRPGSVQHLLDTVSEIHSVPLDRSRPLWECHLIEGIAGRRVALYFKVHHALLDGVATLKYAVGALSRSPDERAGRAIWQPPRRQDGRRADPVGLRERLGRVTRGALQQARSLPELSGAVTRDGLRALGLSRSGGAVPFSAPRTRLARSITPERRLGVKSFRLSRIRRLGKQAGATVNDIVLGMSAGALREYFIEAGELPQRSLTAWVPVSLRTSQGDVAGNSVSVIMTTLATDEADPNRRLHAIHASVQKAKEQLHGRSASTTDNYTQLLSGIVVLTQTLGLADRVAPAANLVVSNVPGPQTNRYLNGARLVGQYPLSMLIDGMALNITVTSHDDRLDFGLLSCPDSVPDPQHMADLLETALESLEAASPGAVAAGSKEMAQSESTTRKKTTLKTAAAKKTTRKKAAVKKTAAGKKTTKKAAHAKAAAKKTSVKKTTQKTAARKTAVRKSVGKKAAARKGAAKRAASGTTAEGRAVPRQAAPASKMTKKKTLRKKTLKKKTSARSTPARGNAAKRITFGDFTQLVTSLAAIPTGALKKLAGGEELTAAAAAEFQKAANRLNEVTSVLRQKTGEQGATREGLDGPDPVLMRAQEPLWNALMDYYFRLEIGGWENIPEGPCLLIGVHSGGPLTMDAWTVALSWWRHFGESRSLHGTAHDVLMTSPGIGFYFRRMGVISPSREAIAAAFEKGDDVILWPGGEVDAYRSWDKRDRAVLGGRKGFIRLAIREGVPIVPVATIGGHDTLFVLSEGRGLARALGLKKRMRVEVAPITLSVPFGVTLHLTPFQHIPLPAKIRTQILEPIELDTDPARENDRAYVDAAYEQIEGAIQKGMDELAKKRKFPVFG